ncbi:MAG TPA: DNA polymerase III subunit delta' [Rhizomicrobium sp.]|jgi:DNA polymerase-3 subunit delta'|nr:DNA polymerase III subunit delta' [Rhizomicrobium sp.]
MAKRAKPEEIIETDRMDGQPHPRETFALIGQDVPLGRAARAIRAGRVPSAWLLTGPPGIGKATLAYRIARYLLAYGATDRGPEDLSVPANDPTAMQVEAGAHPGLLVLKRGINANTGKLMTVLGVDEIRRLAGFFGMTSGAGGWRIAIVDTADDMNDAAANALLKALEEPPARAMLMLLANAPGRLLPTIRSRCQRLDLRPLGEAELTKELEDRVPDLAAKERAQLARLAGGSLGAALSLAGEDGLAMAEEADRLIDRAASPDLAATLALAEKLARTTDGVENFGRFLIEVLTDRIRARALTGAVRLDRWTTLLEQLKSSFIRTDALHLEPRQTILSASRAITTAARGRAL